MFVDWCEDIDAILTSKNPLADLPPKERRYFIGLLHEIALETRTPLEETILRVTTEKLSQAIAFQHDLRFYVAEKAFRGQPWVRKWDHNTRYLLDALDSARCSQAFEAAVFVSTPSGGMIFWTSSKPDLLNTSVLFTATGQFSKKGLANEGE